MRIRNIKPEFWRHRMHRRLSEPATLMALALLNLADDEGRFEADPELIKTAVFPFRTLSKPIQECLEELAQCEWLVLYEAVYQGETVCLGAIRTFTKHQRFSHPQRSRLPAPPSLQSDSRAALEPNQNGSSAILEPLQSDSRAALSGSGIRDQGSGIRVLPPFPPKGGTVGDAESSDPKPNPKLRFDLATACVDYLNGKAGTKFPATHALLHEVALRLQEVGGDLAAVKGMIDRQVALWKNDARMKAYLRPATLFDAEKFHNYFGQRELPVTAARPEERRKELEQLIERSPANRESVYHRPDASEEDRKQLVEYRRELRGLTKTFAPAETA